MSENAFIELKHIEMSYGKGAGSVRALNNVSLRIDQGEFVSILGKSGCGKSTLLTILGGVQKPRSGEYFFEGQNICQLKNRELAAFRNQKTSFVVQHFALVNTMDVLHNIALPLILRRESLSSIKRKVQSLAARLEIEDKLTCFPYELSGGQCQRAAIARAIISDPPVLLADEPTGALDSETGRQIMKIFHELNASGTTIVMVTHDEELARECSRQIYMKDGAVD